MSTLLSSRPLVVLLLLLPCGAPWPAANLLAAAPRAPLAPAQTTTASDPALQQAQARFEILLAAALYTRWPAHSFERPTEGTGVMRVGIVGSDPHAEQLDSLARGRKIAGRHVVVKHYRSPAEVEPCQILYIAGSLARTDRLALLEKYKAAPMLLAGETAGFCDEGGGLNFYVENGNVKFVLNQAVLSKQQLTIDPRFSRLARAPTPPAESTGLPVAAQVKQLRPAGQARPGPGSRPLPGSRDQGPNQGTGSSRPQDPRLQAQPRNGGKLP